MTEMKIKSIVSSNDRNENQEHCAISSFEF